jgi:N-acylglucosamine-6-phosphate 2-epimerase
MTNETIAMLQGGFIVSCQALENEPLHGASMMAAMALAAEEGGAAGVRANTPEDIKFIKQRCGVPVIGLFKRNYPDSNIYITPTLTEVAAIAEAGADLIAMDATMRSRPYGFTLDAFTAAVRKQFPNIPLVADISTFEEGIQAMELGFDLISTTMSGYTPYSPQQQEPDLELVRRLASLKRVPVLAEGRVWSTEQCIECLEAGAYAVVVGTAITRPQEITRRFVEAIQSKLAM